MADTLAALRTTVYTALNSAMPTVKVSKYRRRPGTANRHNSLLEIGVAGSDDAPDLAEVSLRITLKGGLQATEAAIDTLTQAAENGLPASVAAPVWQIFYDEETAMWTAQGFAQGFRE